MAIAEDFRARLLADSDIAGLVGSRIYPGIDKGTTLPSMVYSIDGGVPEIPFTGTSTTADYDVQLDFYTKTYADIANVRRDVLQQFNGFTGIMGNTTVRWSRVDNTFEQIDQSDGHTFRVTFQLSLFTV